MIIFERLRRRTCGKGVFYDRDNFGRSAESLAQANQFFKEECVDPLDPPPFTVFWFRTKRAAEKALLKLPFIHRAADSGKLISELSISYGIYKVPHETGCVAFVLGTALELEGFELAEKSFSRNGVFKNHSLTDGRKRTIQGKI